MGLYEEIDLIKLRSIQRLVASSNKDARGSIFEMAAGLRISLYTYYLSRKPHPGQTQLSY